ncbi:MAG: hypothetical protein KatS3mg029_0850 [Saprospiraceae bacterium]|nr:MAG: hypothetical protein KatS3mg029_0850 [Saprospiraceae bacterium]
MKVADFLQISTLQWNNVWKFDIRLVSNGSTAFERKGMEK